MSEDYIFHDLIKQYDRLTRTGFILFYNEIKEKRPMENEYVNDKIIKWIEQIFKMKTDTNINEWIVEKNE